MSGRLEIIITSHGFLPECLHNRVSFFPSFKKCPRSHATHLLQNDLLFLHGILRSHRSHRRQAYIYKIDTTIFLARFCWYTYTAERFCFVSPVHFQTQTNPCCFWPESTRCRKFLVKGTTAKCAHMWMFNTWCSDSDRWDAIRQRRARRGSRDLRVHRLRRRCLVGVARSLPAEQPSELASEVDARQGVEKEVNAVVEAEDGLADVKRTAQVRRAGRGRCAQ